MAKIAEGRFAHAVTLAAPGAMNPAQSGHRCDEFDSSRRARAR
jgi:hypothetical protein